MDVLHDTFHMTDFRRELRFFFPPPAPTAEGQETIKEKEKR